MPALLGAPSDAAGRPPPRIPWAIRRFLRTFNHIPHSIPLERHVDDVEEGGDLRLHEDDAAELLEAHGVGLLRVHGKND